RAVFSFSLVSRHLPLLPSLPTRRSSDLLIYALSPVLIALFSSAVLGERLVFTQAAGIALSLAGFVHIALAGRWHDLGAVRLTPRSEEHTSELQSRENLVCRLLLEKKKQY